MHFDRIIQRVLYRLKRSFWKITRRADIFFGRVLGIALKRFNLLSISDIRPQDIIVVGYPKSGTTWVQNLIAGVYCGIDTNLLPDRLTQEIVPRLDHKILYKRLSNSMFFCTHLYPKSKFRKVIYLVRDPRDVMASYVKMVSGLGRKESSDDIILKDHYLYFGSWRDHTSAWIENRFESDILYVRFEDLKTDPTAQLERILNFAGLDRTKDVISRSINGNKIESMKRKESVMGLDINLVSKGKFKPGAMFNRSGKVGGYKDVLTQHQIDYIEQTCSNQMRYFNYVRNA